MHVDFSYFQAVFVIDDPRMKVPYADIKNFKKIWGKISQSKINNKVEDDILYIFFYNNNIYFNI